MNLNAAITPPVVYAAIVARYCGRKVQGYVLLQLELAARMREPVVAVVDRSEWPCVATLLEGLWDCGIIRDVRAAIDDVERIGEIAVACSFSSSGAIMWGIIGPALMRYFGVRHDRAGRLSLSGARTATHCEAWRAIREIGVEETESTDNADLTRRRRSPVQRLGKRASSCRCGRRYG